MRRYLLGEVAAEAQLAQIEERLLTDEGYFDTLRAVSDDLIEQYLSDELTPDERERFKGHFLCTPERRKQLNFIRTLRKYNAQRQPDSEKAGLWARLKRWLSLPPVKVLAYALVLLAVGFVGWRVFLHRSDVDEGLAALREAHRDRRPVEARVSSLDYAPLVVTRGGDGGQEKDDLARQLASVKLLNAVRDNPGSAGPRHALGQLYLTERQFDRAVAEFREALKASPDDALLHSDLGAALLEKAKERPEREDYLATLSEALASLDKALSIDGSLRPALFNKALCLQSMSLPGEAKEAWRKYLQVDPDSRWADEARRNLRVLEEQKTGARSAPEILDGFREAARRRDAEGAWRLLSRNREMITWKMIPFHLSRKAAEASAEGRDEEAVELLAALTYAGALEKDRAGDPYFAELAAFYSSAGRDKFALLAGAQREMAAGYELCAGSAYDAALPHFQRAREMFEQAGDALEAKMVVYWIAYCHYYEADKIKESAELLDSLATYARERKYLWLQSQAACWLANCYDLLGEQSKSLAYNRQALELAEAVSDTYLQQKILTQTARQYTQLGQPRNALAYHRRSLALASEGPSSPRQVYRNLTFTTETFYALGRYEAAAAFEQEALRLGSDELKDDQSFVHQSYIHLGIIYAGLRRYPEAASRLDDSLRVARSQSSHAMEAYSTLHLAHVRRLSGDCTGALAHYDEALRLNEKIDVDRYDAHKGKLLCRLVGDDDAATEAEMARVMQLFEQYRGRILEEQNRNTFFDAEQSVYDLAIEYAFRKGRHREAFEISELSRSRSLLDSLRGAAAATTTEHDDGASHETTTPRPAQGERPLDLASVQSRLPARVQLVQYAALKDRLLIWVVSATRFEVIEKPITSAELNARVLEYVKLLTSGGEASGEEVARRAAALYEILIAPVAPLLDASQEVCLVPDKALFHLPFASLISPRTGAHLVRDYTLLFSPSASVLVFCTDEARRRGVLGDETFVGVGNPTFDRVEYPGLPDIPAAGREATEAARIYKSVNCFTNGDALKERVEPLMEKTNVLHFACHYIPNESSPMNSRLLLAKRGGDAAEDASLSAQEVSEKRLRQVRLVVLSACQTLLEGYYNGEGIIGVSRSFIKAGAPLVVASQWPVDSDATAELMINFHRLRKSGGMTTTAALRRAQLDMLEGADERRRSPFYWAAFVPIGGHADY